MSEGAGQGRSSESAGRDAAALNAAAATAASAPAAAAPASAPAAAALQAAPAGAASPSIDPATFADDLVRRALDAGASAAVVLRPAQVVTAEWVRWKCTYGCAVAAGCLTCPPHSPTPAETRRLLDGYETALLLRFDVRPEREEWRRSAAWVLDTALRLEQELFLAGHHKVLALAGGRPCSRDSACGTPQSCEARERLRPGLAGCGIDVFATSANAGWRLHVVAAENEPYHRHALILVT